jgi:hypothetical protein
VTKIGWKILLFMTSHFGHLLLILKLDLFTQSFQTGVKAFKEAAHLLY